MKSTSWDRGGGGKRCSLSMLVNVGCSAAERLVEATAYSSILFEH